MAEVTREEIDALEKRIEKLEAMFEMESVQAVDYDPTSQYITSVDLGKMTEEEKVRYFDDQTWNTDAPNAGSS